MLRHVRFTFRILRRNPSFTFTILLTLALGIGANTAMFSATNTLLLKQLPYPDAQRIVSIYETSKRSGRGQVSLMTLYDWIDQASSFETMSGYRPRSFGLQAGVEGRLTVAQTAMTTALFLDTLGIKTERGRYFTRQEETRGDRLIVLTHDLRQQLFDSNGQVMGQSVLVNEVPYTVIGTLPRDFSFPIGSIVPRAFIPISHGDYGGSRRTRALHAIARIKPSVNVERAATELSGLARRTAQNHPETNKGYGAEFETLHEALRGDNRRPLVLLSICGMLLLFIACTNVVNLIMSRFLVRLKEITMRTVLGASGVRLTQQFLVEGAILCLAGALLGLLVAKGLLLLIPIILPLLGGTSPVADLPLDALRLDGSTLLFTLGICLVITLVLTLIPALLAFKANLQILLKGGSLGQGAMLRSILVITQIGLSTVLLLSTLLLLRSFVKVITTDPGFEAESVVVFGIGIPESRYNTEHKIVDFHQRLLDSLSAVPGVESVSGVARLPTRGRSYRTRFQEAGAGLPRNEKPSAAINIIGRDYIDVMKIPLLRGRRFNILDRPEGRRVIMVNRAFQRTFYKNQDPVGKHLELSWWSHINPKGSTWEIVGMVGDTRQAGLETEAAPEIYLCLGQFPTEGLYYTLRMKPNKDLTQALNLAVQRVDANLQRVTVTPMSEVVHMSLGNRRTMLGFTALFAFIAAMLTAVGIYGLTSFNVGQRRRELMIRMILGATDGTMIKRVLRQALILAAWGIGLGLCAFLFCGKLLAGQLYGLKALDPITLLLTVTGIFLLSTCSALLPAWRITRMDLQP